MSQAEKEAKTQHFLKHFFSLLDARCQKGTETVEASLKKLKKEKEEDEKNPIKEEKEKEKEVNKEEEEEVSSLLQLEQRVALGNTLPQWVHLLCVHATSTQESSLTENTSNNHNKINTNHFTGNPNASLSYIDTDMSESLFNFPHLECVPSPWIARRTPPLFHTRQRLLLHLRQRYNRQLQQCEKHTSFVDALLHALQEGIVGDENTVGREECVKAVESIFSVDSLLKKEQEEQEQEEPPLSLIAEVLFTEWCAAAEGDASFASTTVPLHIIEEDLTNCFDHNVHQSCDINNLNNNNNSSNNEQSKGVSTTTALVGTLTGLACTHPMTAAPREATGKKSATHRSRQRRRNSSSSSDEDDDDDDDDEDYYEDEGDLYDEDVEFNDYDYDVHTDISTMEERRSQRRAYTNNNNSNSRYNRQLNTFIARNTSAFRVPLASLILNVFDVSTDSVNLAGDDSCVNVSENDKRPINGTTVMAMDRYVKLARGEVHCRRGDLHWFVVGDSKRHRSLLESR